MSGDPADDAPLAGVRVLALEQAVAAPFASRHLADLGATVIKVERPEGDFARHYDTHVQGSSAFFVWANRGKHSVVLDLKQPGDRERFDRLLAEADVYLHNLAPDAAARLGLDAVTAAARRPELVACEISGYGAGGPRSPDKAYDLAIQAEAGVFSVTGDADRPSKVGFSVADIAAGTYAYSGILAALVRRGRTGRGAVVSVSMLDALAEWLSAPLYAAVHGGGQPPPTARRHAAIAPYGTFRLSDEREVLLAVQNDREWGRLAADVLDRPDLAADARFAANALRVANVGVLEELLTATLSALPAEDVLTRLARSGIAVADVNTLADVWAHPQLRARDRFFDVATPGGPVEMLRPPIDISGWRPEASRVPALGEHSLGPGSAWPEVDDFS